MSWCNMARDYIGNDGCCLICVEKGKCDNPCPECNCSECNWYSHENWYFN